MSESLVTPPLSKRLSSRKSSASLSGGPAAVPAVAAKVWQGRLPVVFKLADSEVSSFEVPARLYMLVPRMGYFCAPSVRDKVDQHFRNFAPASSNPSMWLESFGKPLRWSYPVGVLWDALFTDSDRLPWEITVHYFGFPTASILQFRSEREVLSMFRNSFKEACYLKFGSSGPAGILTEGEWLMLWNSLQSMEAARGIAVINTVESVGKSSRGLPVRFIFVESSLEDTFLSAPSFQIRRRPISSSEESLTLAEAIRDIAQVESFAEVRIQGINPKLDSTLLSLHNQLCHADRFLYVVILQPKFKGGPPDKLAVQIAEKLDPPSSLDSLDSKEEKTSIED